MLKAATDAANGNADAAAYLRYAEVNDIQRQVSAGTQPTQAIASTRWARPDMPSLEDIKLQYDISGNAMLGPEMRGAAVAKAKAMEAMQARDLEYRMNLFKNIPKPLATPSEATPIQVGGVEGVRIGDRVTFPPSTASGQMTPFQQESTDIRKKAMTEAANNRRITQLQKSLDSIDMLQAARMSNTPDEKLTPAQRTQKSRYLKYTQELDQLMGNTSTGETQGKTLTKEIAAELLKQSGGDKIKARQLARSAGYSI
jgi:hypothetical protein